MIFKEMYQALKHLTVEHGADVIKNEEMVLGYILQNVQEGKKLQNLIRAFYGCNGAVRIFEAETGAKETLEKQLVEEMKDTYWLDEEAAQKAFEAFWKVIGGEGQIPGDKAGTGVRASTSEYFALAVKYEYGRGCQKDLQMAKEYYKLALKEPGMAAVSAYALGEICRKEKADAKKIFQYYKMAADCEHLLAYSWYAELMRSGKGCVADEKNGRRLLEQAANGLRSQVWDESCLAIYKQYGLRDLYEKYLWALQNGDAEAQYMLAICYRPDPTLAAGYYERAAEGGHAGAAWRIYDDCRTQKESWNKCFEWSPKKAYEICVKAVEKGIMEAMCWLGKCYEEGIGCVSNQDMAVSWYMKNIEAGGIEGILHMAAYYINTVRDLEECELWYIKAAERGSAKAAEFLGDLYMGESMRIGGKYEVLRPFYGVSLEECVKNAETAKYWYRKAIENHQGKYQACEDAYVKKLEEKIKRRR